MTTDKKSRAVAVPPSFPVHWLAVIGIGGTWLALAIAETLLSGGQDALDDVAMIGENYSLIAASGVLHWVAAIVLIGGLAGVAPLIWASRIGRIGWSLTTLLAAGLGAFAMVHLLALETAATGLDGSAMNQFLTERLGDGSGPWIVPVLFVALVGPWSFALLLFGLVRVHCAHWAAPVVFVVGALIHMLIASELWESISIWVMAAGAVLGAYGILRSRARMDDGVSATADDVTSSDDLLVR